MMAVTLKPSVNGPIEPEEFSEKLVFVETIEKGLRPLDDQKTVAHEQVKDAAGKVD